MANNWARYIPWIYVSIQVSITLIVSVIGAKFVKNEFKRQSDKMKKMQIQINIQQQTSDEKDEEIQQASNDDSNEATKNDGIEDEKTMDEKKEDQMDKFKKLSKIGFCKLYFNTVWKLRSVYGSLAVHAFDVLTDILVIANWWDYEKDKDVQDVDARTMAWCGITVLLFHKLITVIAFWAKEANPYRCLLQLFDLLIFEEIFVSHKKILIQLSDDDENNDNDSIETTSSFKFVRNLEAIFESIPQSILQLVFIMRTKWETEGEGIFLFISIASIIQSIISMTNSIIKNDNVYMTLPKYKKYKKRFPPSWSFIKHLLARSSEVIYRIGLLALFWSVCILFSVNQDTQ